MGEAFYKLAGLYALQQVRDALAALVAPIQLAFARGGSESAVQILQVALEMRDNIAVTVDIENAYNTRKRSQILRDLYEQERLRGLWKLAHWSYGRPTPLLLMENGRLVKTMSSEEGVRQGDVLGAGLFAISMVKLYNNAVENTDTLALAIMDDIYFVGDSKSVLTSFDNFVGGLAGTGLRHNQSKSCVLIPSDASRRLRQACTERKLQICVDTMPALGAKVGWIPEDISEWVYDKMIKSHTPFFDAIRHTALPAQHAVALLRLCMLPRMNFWTRVLPPVVVAKAARAFDDRLLETACFKLGLRTPLPDMAQKLLRLPVRLGGLGLRSMEEVSPVAWWSALAEACPNLVKLYDDKTLVESPQGRTQAKCWEYFKLHQAKCDGKLIPKTIHEFWVVFRKPSRGCAGLQREVLKVLEEAQASALVARERKNSPQTVARLISCKAPSAGAWLTTPLTDPLLRLNSVQFSLAVRLRLGLRPQDDPGRM